MLAYGRDPVGIQNSAFEKIQPSEELDPVQGEKPLRQICEPEIEAPKTSLVSDMMNGQHGLERQPLCMHEHRHQRRSPIVRVQDLQLRCQSARQFQRRLAKKDKSRGVIFISFAPFAVNSVAIEKFIATNQIQLDAAGASALEILRRVSAIANRHVDSDPCVLSPECAVISNFAVERKHYTNLMPSGTQCSRQPIHDIDNRSRSLEWRPFGANHQNSHRTFDVKNFKGYKV